MLKAASDHWKNLEKTLKFLRIYEVRSPKADKAMHSFCYWFGGVCNGIQGFLKTESIYNNNERSEVE